MSRGFIFIGIVSILFFCFTNCSSQNQFTSSSESSSLSSEPQISPPATTSEPGSPRSSPAPPASVPNADPDAPPLGFTEPVISGFRTNDCPVQMYPAGSASIHSGEVLNIGCLAYVRRFISRSGKSYIRLVGIATSPGYDDLHLTSTFDITLDFSRFHEDQLTWIVGTAAELSVPLLVPTQNKRNFLVIRSTEFLVSDIIASVHRASFLLWFQALGSPTNGFEKTLRPTNGEQQTSSSIERVPWETP